MNVLLSDTNCPKIYINQSIIQGLFSIQTKKNNNIHTYVNIITERVGNEVILLI